MLQFQYSEKNPLMPIGYASFRAMHTNMEIILPGHDRTESYGLISGIYEMVLGLDAMLNRFDPGSQLSMINHSAGCNPVSIGKEMIEIFKDCLFYWEKTAGFFDVTVNSEVAQPYDERGFEIDEEGKTIRFVHPEVQIDLGGFAKGYALKRIETLLKGAQVESCLVNFGSSSILGLGHHPYGDSWQVGVKHIYQEQESVQSFRLRDQALSVSGNIPQYPRHIISPQTHQYMTNQSMIAVEGESGLTAEVLSTALFAAPAGKRADILSNFPDYKTSVFSYDADSMYVESNI